MDDIVGNATRCVLAVAGRHGPLLSPMACWSDGTALWMSTPATAHKVAALRGRPECAVYVAPTGTEERGSVVHGPGRVYGPDDPLGLALHGPAVSAAMAALALRNAPSLLGYVQDAARVPWRFAWQNRVALKVAVRELHGVGLPELGPGVAPALPTEVPSDVRRALAGGRRAVLALRPEGAAEEPDGGRLVVGPVALGAGYALGGLGALGVIPPAAPGGPVADPQLRDEPAALLLTADDRDRRPTSVVGLMLRGRLRGNRLEPTRVTWWQGFRTTTVAVSPRPAGSVVLPD